MKAVFTLALYALTVMLLLSTVSCNKGFVPFSPEATTGSPNENTKISPWQSNPGRLEQDTNGDESANDDSVPEVAPTPIPKPTVTANSETEEEATPSTPTVSATPTATPNPKPAATPSGKEKDDDIKSGTAANDNSEDFVGPGKLKPSVYFFATFNEDDSKCEKDSVLHGPGGREIMKVCKRTEAECGQQGSCGVIQDGQLHSFNILGRTDGQDRYFEIDRNKCRYGYGVQSACLDPFYTLAADMDLYKPGQVIYVPAVVGTVLPDGSKHSGYFVVRDQGRGIKGTGRFDFFSGTVSWKDPKNPFSKMGLADTDTNIPYYKVSGKTARQVLLHRAFPVLPKK